ncbi:hypothetical protein [Dolichospermum sp. UHCC 0259]|uniref:hypothetical protein n=1 Tax=Dolichospermum sp. UHCC 0259 TaxID=2590010 RepID=UPI001EB5F20E|nr:hypothetical protein [Dolichospermum sp. UHCC 0259]MTJ49312.1 hypothetical protein [Dolichospermum sp. UHCC 0259]
MSPNEYRPHLIVLGEDDAHRQIVNGFCLDLNVNPDVIQLLENARGWGHIMDEFKDVYIQKLRQNS